MNCARSILLIAFCVWPGSCAFGQTNSVIAPNKQPVATSGSEKRSVNSQSANPRVPAPNADVPSPSDAKSLASLLRPKIPKGWTLSINDDRVVVERTQPIEVYNGIGLPGFRSEEQRRKYVRPQVRKMQFAISLWLGDRMTKREVQLAKRKNSDAVENARRDEKDGKFLSDDKFWQQHPEYEYRDVPSYYTPNRSIYLDVTARPRPPGSQGGSLWQYWDESVEIECWKVFDGVGKLFEAY